MVEPRASESATLSTEYTVASFSQLDGADLTAWDALARLHAVDAPFLQVAVLRGMARMAADRSAPLFILVRTASPGHLVGGLAFGVTVDRQGPFSRRRVHAQSPGRSDLTQLLVAPEHRVMVERAIARHLERLRMTGTVFDILGTRLSATILDRLGPAWRHGRSHPIREASLEGATSWRDVIRSGHQRREILRASRGLARDHNPTLRWAESAGDAPELIDAFRALHTREQRARGRPAAFESPAAQTGLRELFANGVGNGSADVAVLTSDSGHVIAGYTLLHAGALTFAYRTAFDGSFARYAPGTQLLASAIDRAIDRGSTRFGFSWGDEPYKAHWSEVTDHVIRLQAGAPGHRHIGYRLLERLRRHRTQA